MGSDGSLMAMGKSKVANAALQAEKALHPCSPPCRQWYECHFPFVTPFRLLAFHPGAWLGQPAIVIAPPLLHTRLVTVGPVRDPMAGDGIQQLVVQAQAAGGVTRGSELQ